MKGSRNDLLRQVGRQVSRQLRAAAADAHGYRKRVATPKAERERFTVLPPEPFDDPVARLGHAARPRTGRGVGVRR